MPERRRISERKLMMDFRKVMFAIGIFMEIVLLGGANPAFAGTSCPWQGPDNSAVCSRWDATMQRLEAAAERAQAAANRLESMADEKAIAPAEADRARIKTLIERFLDNFVFPLPESSGFEIDRDFNLTQEGAVYTATLPKAAWAMDSLRADFGPLTFRIQPRSEGLYTVDFRLGDLITLRDSDKVLARLLISDQDNQAVWDDALQNFTLITWRLGQLNLVVTDTPVSLTLDTVSLNQALSRSDDDTWNQRQNLELADLTLQLREDTLSIDRIVGQFYQDGRNYKQWLNLRSEFKAADKVSDVEATQRLIAFLDGISTLFSRFDSSVFITDLTLSKAKGPLTTIKRMSLGSGFKEGNGATVNFQIQMADLQTQLSGVPNGLLPTAARLELALANLPPKLLGDIMRISLASEQLAEEKQEDFLDNAFSSLFLNSRLGLSLKDSYISTADSRLEVNANSTINPKAALGMTGEFHLRIEGLDKILDRSANLIDKETAGPLLALLIALSNRTQSDGKVIDSFAMKLTEDGKVWLNGKDVTVLFMPSDRDSG